MQIFEQQALGLDRMGFLLLALIGLTCNALRGDGGYVQITILLFKVVVI